MDNKGQHTFAEIISQPTVWTEVLAAFHDSQRKMQEAWVALRPQAVMFIGCGSTHYLSQTAAVIFQDLTGIPSTACPSSELLLFPSLTVAYPEHTLLITISRSGTTTETIEAVNRFRQVGGLAVWGITCYPKSTLPQLCDLTLLAEAAQEESVAQTRSFSSMLLLVQALAATVGGRETDILHGLPLAAQETIETSTSLIQQLGKQMDLQRFFFLGSSAQYGLANELMLKMKEISLSHSEAFHFLEFRHGPMSMANEQALIVGLLSQTAYVHETLVLKEMAVLGAHTLGVNAHFNDSFQDAITFNLSLPAWAMPVLYLPPLQLLAYYRAIAKGLDPDNPQNLTVVVTLDPLTFSTQQTSNR